MRAQTHTSARIGVHTGAQHVHTDTPHHLHVCTQTHINTYRCAHTYTSTYTCACTDTSAHICVHTHTSVGVPAVGAPSHPTPVGADGPAEHGRVWGDVCSSPLPPSPPRLQSLKDTGVTFHPRKLLVFLTGPKGQETWNYHLAASSEDTRHFCVGVRDFFKQFPWKRKLPISSDHIRQVLCMSPVA